MKHHSVKLLSLFLFAASIANAQGIGLDNSRDHQKAEYTLAEIEAATRGGQLMSRSNHNQSYQMLCIDTTAQSIEDCETYAFSFVEKDADTARVEFGALFYQSNFSNVRSIKKAWKNLKNLDLGHTYEAPGFTNTAQNFLAVELTAAVIGNGGIDGDCIAGSIALATVAVPIATVTGAITFLLDLDDNVDGLIKGMFTRSHVMAYLRSVVKNKKTRTIRLGDENFERL